MKKFIIFVVILINSFCAYGVDGYKDLKFGMSLKDVKNVLIKKKICDASKYPAFGWMPWEERVMCLPGYSITNNEGMLLFFKDNKLIGIELILGEYNKDKFVLFRKALEKKYKVFYNFTKEDAKKFEAGMLDDISNEYDKGTIVLTLTRNKKQKIDLNLTYRDISIVPKKTKKKNLKDDL